MLIVLLIGLVLIRESHEQPLAGIEENFTNWLAANTTREIAPAPLVLVEIKDSSLEKPHAWPWSPLDFAIFLDNALQFNPAAIGIEPVLEWNPKQLPPDAQMKFTQFETLLHEHLLLAPKIVLAAQLGFPEDPDVAPAPQAVPLLRNISGSTRDVPQFTAVEHEPKEDLRLNAALGFINVPTDRTPIRRASLLFSYQGQIVPSFVLQSLMLWLNVLPDEVKVTLGAQIALGNKATIPIDSTGAMLVDFKSPFTRVAFEDLSLSVAQMQAKTTPAIAPDTFKNKLVILARTDHEARTLALPIGHNGSAGELFAAAIATVQNHAFIRRISIWFDACVIVVMMAWSWFLYQQPRRSAFWKTCILLVIYLMIGLAIFSTAQLALPLVMPLGLAIFVVLFRFFAPKEGLLASH